MSMIEFKCIQECYWDAKGLYDYKNIERRSHGRVWKAIRKDKQGDEIPGDTYKWSPGMKLPPEEYFEPMHGAEWPTEEVKTEAPDDSGDVTTEAPKKKPGRPKKKS